MATFIEDKEKKENESVEYGRKKLYELVDRFVARSVENGALPNIYKDSVEVDFGLGIGKTVVLGIKE